MAYNITVTAGERFNKSYAEYKETWEKCEDFYLGGLNVTAADKKALYLPRHISESIEQYNNRVQSVYYDNKIKEPLDSLFAFIFSSRLITRSGGDFLGDMKDSFLDDVDGKGSDIRAFMTEVSKWAAVHGVCYIYIEPPYMNASQQKETVSMQDIKNNNILPLFHIIKRCQVCDWSHGSDGMPTMVKIRFEKLVRDAKTDIEKAEPFYLRWEKIPDSNKCQWAYFSASEMILNDWTVVDIPFIPIVAKYGIKKADFVGLPLVQDCADIANAIYINDNRTEDFLAYAAHCQLVCAVANDEEAKALSNVKRGNQYIMTFPSGAVPPQYLAISQAPFISLSEQKNKLVQAIYQNLKQRLQDLSTAQTTNSGESKKQDWKVTSAELSNLAHTIQECENMAYFIQMLWLKNDIQSAIDSQITVFYPDVYEVNTTTEELEELQIKRSMGFPKTYLKAKIKQIIEADPIYALLSEEEKEEIENELYMETIKESAAVGLDEKGVEEISNQMKAMQEEDDTMSELAEQPKE